MPTSSERMKTTCEEHAGLSTLRAAALLCAESQCCAKSETRLRHARQRAGRVSESPRQDTEDCSRCEHRQL